MPSSLTQVNQLNFVCEDCYFPARDSSHLKQHKSTGKCKISPEYPDVDSMTTDQQEDFIYNTQRFKSALELIKRTPKYQMLWANITADTAPHIKALQDRYKQEEFKTFKDVLKFYSKEFNKQRHLIEKRKQNEEYLKLLESKKKEQQVKKDKERAIKEATEMLELQKLKDLEAEREKEAQRKREQKEAEDQAKSRIANIKIRTKEQRIELKSNGINSSVMMSMLHSLASSAEEEQSEHYSIEIPNLTQRQTYDEPIDVEPEQEPTPEPEEEPTPEPEEDLDPNRFNMKFRRNRKGIEQWNNPAIFEEYKDKPRINNITIRDMDRKDDTIQRVVFHNTKGGVEHFYTAYFSEFNHETKKVESYVLYYEEEPEWDTKEQSIIGEGYSHEHFQPLDKYRCVCGCGRAIGWFNEYRTGYDGDDMGCLDKQGNLYIKYNGDWRAIQAHR